MPSVQSVSFEMLQSAAKRMKAESPSSEHAAMTPRCRCLHLGVLVGSLCASVLKSAPLDEKRDPLEDAPNPRTVSSFWTSPDHVDERDQIAQSMGQLLWGFFVTAEVCSLNLQESIYKKIQLNERKYPVELCRGKSGKYTAYSDKTGITKTQGQSTLDCAIDSSSSMSSMSSTIEETTKRIRKFATDRLWSRFHSPRSLLLALMGELGELAELFQWKGDDKGQNGLEGWAREDQDKVGQELADVSIYLLRLADVCCIDNIGALALEASSMSCNNE